MKKAINTIEAVYFNSIELIAERKASAPSHGERVIAKYLKARKIAFIKEHWFKDCYNRKTNHLLFFDFYIPSLNMCIEFQGPHHYTPLLTPEQSERDIVKVRYCKARGIKLLAVHYMELQSFSELFKEFTRTVVVNHTKRVPKPKKPKRTPYRGFEMISEERHNEIVAKKKTGGKNHTKRQFKY